MEEKGGECVGKAPPWSVTDSPSAIKIFWKKNHIYIYIINMLTNTKAVKQQVLKSVNFE